jgi:hypothetical protein
MDVDVAAEVLAGSILTMLSLIVVVIGIVVVNNIFHKYWKPVQWMRMMNHPMYVTREHLSEHKEETKVN